MPDQPASPPLILQTADGQPITLTDLRWPFQQLNATGVPATLPIASPDVVLTLSMLAAMRDGVPTLVQYDDAGRVLATGDRVPQGPFSFHPLGASTQNIVLTPGTESMSIKVHDTEVATSPSTVKVNGHDSGFPYLDEFTVSRVDQEVVVRVDHAQDHSVDLIFQNNSINQDKTVLVTLVKAIDELVMLSQKGQEPKVQPLPGTVLTTDTIKTAGFNVTLGAGASLVLVPAVGGTSVFCLELFVSVDTAGAAQVDLESDVPQQIAVLNTTALGKASHRLYGAQMGIGAAARLRNRSGVASGNFTGELVYIQKIPGT